MSKITISCNKLNEGHTIPLPGSKSESNRALIINALAENPGRIANLAIARDTEIMTNLLAADHEVYDARDAGTVMRFMTAYLAVSRKNVIITGTERMKLRPIGVLVEALRALGVKIDFLEEQGYPPLRFNGFDKQLTRSIEVEGNISSQYISALLMIAPRLPLGLILKIKGELVSKPYIDMTLSIMRHFGVEVDASEHEYTVSPQTYHYSPFSVEADWSGASYWYSIFALSSLKSLVISGLKPDSTQGDSVLQELMLGFGVKTEFLNEKAILTRTDLNLPDAIDFIKCPDLAQTFAVLCAAMGHSCTFYGLQTLKIKETDRVLAIKTELNKLGGDFVEENNSWTVEPILAAALTKDRHYDFATYEDHRMAMAFAPLAVKTSISFDDREVVNKSYPTFWDDMAGLGFEIS